MTLPLRKRTVHFYEILIQSHTLAAAITNPSTATLPDMLRCFAQMALAKHLPITIRRSAHLRTVLADWHYDNANDCYELLLSKANAALSDVALRDLTNSKLRKAGKTKVEGIEVSAHVIVRPNSDRRTAAVLLTMGAGVSANDIEILFRHLARQASKIPANKALFYFDDPLQYKVSYRFAALGHKGQTLETALRTGEFESMELVACEHTKFDAGGNLQIEERTLKVKSSLPKTVTAASLRNALRSFRQEPDSAIYNKLRIHYKTEGGKSTSAVLSVQDLDAAFTLKEHIEFDTDVESQQAALTPTILQAMHPLLQLVPPQ